MQLRPSSLCLEVIDGRKVRCDWLVADVTAEVRRRTPATLLVLLTSSHMQILLPPGLRRRRLHWNANGSPKCAHYMLKTRRRALRFHWICREWSELSVIHEQNSTRWWKFTCRGFAAWLRRLHRSRLVTIAGVCRRRLSWPCDKKTGHLGQKCLRYFKCSVAIRLRFG